VSTPLAALIAERARRLEAAGIDQAQAEIELIFCHVLRVDRLKLYLDGQALLSPDSLSRIDDIVERRTSRYPLQFILGEAWFYGRKFRVTPAVMAPTPETEVLCEAALGYCRHRNWDKPSILDIGIGSGVISLTLAAEMPESTVLALDISTEAIEVARANAAALGLTDRVRFRQSDLLGALDRDQRFDLIVSNPPYIAEPDYAELDPEVLADPRIAMVSGQDGLDAIRGILEPAPDHLNPHGRLMFEMGYNQAEPVAAITEEDDRYTSLEFIRDLNDIDRVAILGCDR
jgi:release factor glutamine methyltransferase